MNQLALSRRSDPVSSHEAAERVDTFKARHEAKIYEAIHGSRNGLTMHEIAWETRLESVQVGRRLSAMGARGLITRREAGTPGMVEMRDRCAVWFIS